MAIRQEIKKRLSCLEAENVDEELRQRVAEMEEWYGSMQRRYEEECKRKEHENDFKQ